ncbi:hypothetical protein D7X32_39630 [Corallococcus carmarthensis]|uniref:Uncharacterized protein n=1 Tax=Corallococcus carmarthensis TaxID=2316728 RepID=A0A3A8JU38_9BACT|nr:hypothetical protein D7X32_39630 [Corallococcus carmarthensis]
MAGLLMVACGGGLDAAPELARQESALCGYCGDNLCDPATEAYSCPQDCGQATCGDGACCNETPDSCPQDCPYAAPYCYDTPIGFAREGQAAPPRPLPEARPRFTGSLTCAVCGDNVCDPASEDRYSCPQDCTTVCGDGVCCQESPSSCPQDCPYAAPYCYDTPVQ